MSEFSPINSVCQDFNVTSRTLRYYEEIGLIKSIRKGDGNYRYYDELTIRRIEQILAMRRLTLTVKEIQAILSTQSIELVIETFVKKLEKLRNDLNENVTLIKNIEEMIDVLHVNQIKHGTFKEVFHLDEFSSQEDENDILMNSDLLNEWNIRIIRLNKMKVAYYIAQSEHPEVDAWNVLKAWVKEQGLANEFSTRYFGFNNPNPKEGTKTYGYEVWVTVGEAVQGNDKINIKTFEGGLYAVKTSSIENIVQTWKQLGNLVEESLHYKIGERWLEEHLIVDEASWTQNFQVDLYCALELKKEEGKQ